MLRLRTSLGHCIGALIVLLIVVAPFHVFLTAPLSPTIFNGHVLVDQSHHQFSDWQPYSSPSHPEHTTETATHFDDIDDPKTPAQAQDLDYLTTDISKEPLSFVSQESTNTPHPIDDLVQTAKQETERLLAARREDVASAAQAYRARRGRNPPPQFDKWVTYAKANNALIVEEFFDQIYHDLEPFWGVSLPLFPFPQDWPFSIHIRNGTASVRQHPKSHISGEWDQLWLDMLQQIEEYLPDVDMAFNDLDEPRISVPWQTMSHYMTNADILRKQAEASVDDGSFISKYSPLPEVPRDEDQLAKLDGVDLRWENPTSFWEIIRNACSLGSLAHNATLDQDMSVPPKFPQEYPSGSYHGYVANWTTSKSVCEHAHLRNMHGAFVAPRYNSVNTTLFPLFSGCKIQGVNNEILVPAAKYWAKGKRFSFKSEYVPWEEKLDQIVWRGQASGGWHTKNNWKRFHRHRFIAMLNGTAVDLEERAQLDVEHTIVSEPPHNLPLPNSTLWDLAALKTFPTRIGRWVSPFADAGFNHFHCNPWRWTALFGNRHCVYTDPYYSAKQEMALSEQFNYKFLPDIDGNSYSGRFRAFMQSASLPIKATIWAEWHDTRLVPWQHFIPMDNTFSDWWGILEYLVGFTAPKPRTTGMPEDRPGHDTVAKAIAEQGRDWAATVLRDEDMLVYMYRLILEYARVCSKDRERMAYVADLVVSV